MKKVLVMGGTRFFGKKLVELLIAGDYEVSIATRGVTRDSFPPHIKRFIVERNDQEGLREIARYADWDIVYDQICFSPEAALIARDAFTDRTGNYIFTSSQVVYEASEQPLKEEDFDPYHYEIKASDPLAFNYAEGKKMAEAVFFQQRYFPAVAVRFPMVLGLDDHTRRMNFHIERVKKQQVIGIPDPEARLSFISAAEAAQFLFWLAAVRFTGPINACAAGQSSLAKIMAIIEKELEQQAIVCKQTDSENISPYFLKNGSWYMDNSRAEKMGFHFSHLDDWLEDLIKDTIRWEALQ